MTFSKLTRRAGLAAVLACTTALAAQAQDMFDPAQMTPDQRAAFGEAVRAYLLDNPRVIMEAVSVLEERDAQAQAQADVALVQSYDDQIFDDGYSWVGGNPDGDVTIVEFMDYRCGYCRRAWPEVEQLIEFDGDIRFIVKEFPILGEASMILSRFAIATQIVEGDDAYKAMHDALMALDGDPSNQVLSRLANTLGHDADAILAEMDSPEVDRRIADTRALAQALQISGTPTFVFGDQLVRGYVPLDGMQQIVDEVRAEG